MQKIINIIKRSGWQIKCGLLAFVVLNCFAVSVWVSNPGMWTAASDDSWQVAVAELTLGVEVCLLLLVAGLSALFVIFSQD